MKTEEFFSLLRKDREDAITWLYNTYFEKLFRSAYCYIGSYADAEDICQEVFTDVTDAIGSYRGNAGIYTWVYSIFLNKARDFHRKQDNITSKKQHHNISVCLKEKLQTKDPAELAEQKDIQEHVVNAVQNLPNDMRLLIIMRYFDKLSGKQMAEILGISHGRVRSKLSEARTLLRNKLISIGV